METTNWFKTNYYYIVPEFTSNQEFSISSTKVFDEFDQAQKILRKTPKPVMIGPPISYLLLGNGFRWIDLIRIDHDLSRIARILERSRHRMGASLTEPFWFWISPKRKKPFNRSTNISTNMFKAWQSCQLVNSIHHCSRRKRSKSLWSTPKIQR